MLYFLHYIQKRNEDDFSNKVWPLYIWLNLFTNRTEDVSGPYIVQGYPRVKTNYRKRIIMLPCLCNRWMQQQITTWYISQLSLKSLFKAGAIICNNFWAEPRRKKNPKTSFFPHSSKFEPQILYLHISLRGDREKKRKDEICTFDGLRKFVNTLFCHSSSSNCCRYTFMRLLKPGQPKLAIKSN